MAQKREMVKVFSGVHHRVVLKSENQRFKKVFTGKNTMIPVEKELLRDMMYENGVMTLFKEGLLYIEDLEDAKDLTIEDPDAKEKSVVIYSDAEMESILKDKTFNEFKKIVDEMPAAQREEMASLAIAKKIMNYDKNEYLGKLTRQNITKAITLSAE